MITLAQLAPWPGDCTYNTKLITETIQAAGPRSQIIIFSELVLTGYPVLDYITRLEPAVKQSWDTLRAVSQAYPDLYCLIGTPYYTAGQIYNALCVLKNGQIIHTYKKQCLPDTDVFNESRYFTPGTESQILTAHNLRIGLSICEDAWHITRDPIQAYRNLDYIINISASPYESEKYTARLRQFSAVATACNTPVIMVNQVGGCDGLIFDGGSLYLDKTGAIITQLPQFEPMLMSLDKPACAFKKTSIHEALCLGIRDFVMHTGVSGVVIAISGGIDSALVACLAVTALGADRVQGVYMPGPYSSASSADDAHALALNLGIRFHTHSIQGYMTQLQDTMPAMTRLSIENAQARYRGLTALVYANQDNCAVLATGNKSELAVGYCTLYGDMVGGLAPIGDVYKTQVYALADAYSNVIPPHTRVRAPSAELWPNQADTDTLPDYSILDAILYDYIDRDYTWEALIQAGHDPVYSNQVCRLIHRAEHKRRQAPPVIKVSRRAFGRGWQYTHETARRTR